MNDNNETMADSAAQQMENAANMAKNAVSAGKDIASGAARIASGDVAGGAAQILTSESTRKVIAVGLVIVIAIGIILLCAVFAMPTALYEGVQAYFEKIDEEWSSVYYSGDYGRAEALLRATVHGVSTALGDFWDYITGAGSKNDATQRDSDQYGEADLTLMGDKEAMAEVMLRKILSVNDKMAARSRQIVSAVEDSARTGAISGYFSDRFQQDKMQYENDETVGNIVYDGVQVMVTSQFDGENTKIRAGDVMRIMALYTSLYGESTEDMELSGLMKWMGYYDEFHPGSSEFTVGDQITLSIPAWRGTFMPRYLVLESRQNTDGDYSQYMCPAVDILLKVSSPNFAEVQPIIDDTETMLVYEPAPTPGAAAAPGADEPPSGETDGGRPTPEPAGEGAPSPTPEQALVEKKIIKIRYVVAISVSIRKVDSLVELAGLYEGSVLYGGGENGTGGEDGG